MAPMSFNELNNELAKPMKIMSILKVQYNLEISFQKQFGDTTKVQ